MMIVRATKRLLQRLPASRPQDGERSTTVLGDWYATTLFWKPQQVVLLVNEATLLPAFMPLAPVASLPARIGEQIAATLATHQAPHSVIENELREMRDCRFAPTASRSVIGIMNEFTRLAEHHRSADPSHDLLALAVSLSRTPCGPLYRRHISPDRELHALLGSSE